MQNRKDSTMNKERFIEVEYRGTIKIPIDSYATITEEDIRRKAASEIIKQEEGVESVVLKDIPAIGTAKYWDALERGLITPWIDDYGTVWAKAGDVNRFAVIRSECKTLEELKASMTTLDMATAIRTYVSDWWHRVNGSTDTEHSDLRSKEREDMSKAFIYLCEGHLFEESAPPVGAEDLYTAIDEMKAKVQRMDWYLSVYPELEDNELESIELWFTYIRLDGTRTNYVIEFSDLRRKKEELEKYISDNFVSYSEIILNQLNDNICCQSDDNLPLTSLMIALDETLSNNTLEAEDIMLGLEKGVIRIGTDANNTIQAEIGKVFSFDFIGETDGKLSVEQIKRKYSSMELATLMCEKLNKDADKGLYVLCRLLAEECIDSEQMYDENTIEYLMQGVKQKANSVGISASVYMSGDNSSEPESASLYFIKEGTGLIGTAELKNIYEERNSSWGINAAIAHICEEISEDDGYAENTDELRSTLINALNEEVSKVDAATGVIGSVLKNRVVVWM